VEDPRDSREGERIQGEDEGRIISSTARTSATE
jgi:hypothetical protein